jgi:hypothetical protein
MTTTGEPQMGSEPPYEPDPGWPVYGPPVATVPPVKAGWSKGRKWLAGVGIAVAAVAVVGGIGRVGNPDPPEATRPAVSVTPGSVGTVLTSGQQAYATEIRRLMPGLIGVDDRVVVTAGESVCGYWRQPGSNFPQIAAATRRSGFTAAEAGWIIGSATANLCPEYLGKIPR